VLIDESYQKYTAFLTIAGIFSWMRVPMGIKPAAAYFQCMMMTIVLVGYYMSTAKCTWTMS